MANKTITFRNFHLEYLLKWVNPPIISERRLIRKFVVPLNDLWKVYNDERNELLIKYCDKKDDGTLDTTVNGTQTIYQFKKLDEATKKEFDTAITELSNADATLDVLESMTGAVILAKNILQALNIEIDDKTVEGQLADAAYEGIMNAFEKYEENSDKDNSAQETAIPDGGGLAKSEDTKPDNG